MKSSPTGRADKCYYYAPDYNLDRFEEAQGYIASNHFSAKVSSTSFKGVFYLMSVRMGDHYIKLSTTVALNSIRKTEELEKGWKKNDIRLPVEFEYLDPVHIVPLTRVEIDNEDLFSIKKILTRKSLIKEDCFFSWSQGVSRFRTLFIQF